MTSPTPPLRPVVVLGSINTDLVVRTPRFPRPGETMHGSAFAVIGGGKGANQATAAARLGAPVQFIGAVGADDFGTRRIEEMQQAGVDTGAVRRLAGAPTGVALITVNDAGENTIIIAAGANWQVTPADIPGILLAMAAGGVLVCQLELPMETVAAGLVRAREAGLTTLLNTAPYKPDARAMLPYVDILVANEGEAGDLADWASVVSEGNAADVAARLHARGPRTVIVTLGAAGVVVSASGRTIHVPAPRVAVVDTTGAGDCFTGALAASLVGGLELEVAAKRAVAAASYSTTIFGATTGMPTTEELDDFSGHIRKRSAARKGKIMQANNPPQIQFGPGGEQWWQIPVGAAVYASDGVPIGAIAAMGTAYMQVSDSMMGDGALHIPLQTIGQYDPQANVVRLSVASNVVRGMTDMPPANDPLSLQAMHHETLPLPAAQPPMQAHMRTITLREQELVITRLPNVIKDVTVRRDATGEVTISDPVERETMHGEMDEEPE